MIRTQCPHCYHSQHVEDEVVECENCEETFFAISEDAQEAKEIEYMNDKNQFDDE